MNDEKSALEQLVSDASTTLKAAETSLQQLARTAFDSYQQLRIANGDIQPQGDDPRVKRLQQIGEQLSKLSRRSGDLQSYLQNGLDTPPVDDEYWSRIKILQSQEEERTQMARELEDSVGQLLANAVFELASSRHLLETGDAAVSEGLDALQQELEQGLADIRHFITDLEPAAILGNFGLGGGIRRYLEQFETRTGIGTRLRIKTNIGRLPGTIEVAIFRVIQEALQNVHRHAYADQVDVVFSESDGLLEFSIIDNGNGMVSDRVDISKKNFGLARMVDYADLMNGRLRIFSEPEHGTRVLLSIPYHAL